MEFDNTSEIVLPADPLDMVIGQEKSVSIARIAAGQRRHLLLVGPPGVGKSMLAKALAYHLPKPEQEIVVAHNPQNPERPIAFIRGAKELEKHKALEKKSKGRLVGPDKIPEDVAERLGFKCMGCSKISSNEDEICPHCKDLKIKANVQDSPFSDLLSQVFNVEMCEYPEEEVQVTKVGKGGVEEIIIYQTIDGKNVRVLDGEAFQNLNELQSIKKSKVLVPLKRNSFIPATGASETELLGDVKHDPWGGVPDAGGALPYQRVIAGAIHEAHEGVLFIDELPQLQNMQHHILTAMQEKQFPISGMNSNSAGAAVKVTKVPCDFIFVGACNITDVSSILAPLRSRILGSGYELLLDTTMPKTKKNIDRIGQFFAQEVILDSRIPHGSAGAVKELVKLAEARAQQEDGAKDSLSLRLRDLGGVVRLGGDLAKIEKSELIEPEHIKEAIKNSRSVEEQLIERYGSVWRGQAKDHSKGHLLSSEKDARGYI